MAWENGERPAIGAQYRSRYGTGSRSEIEVLATWQNGCVCSNQKSYTAKQFTTMMIQVGEDPQLDLLAGVVV